MNLVEQRPFTISFTPRDSQFASTDSPIDHRPFDAQQMIEELTNGDRAQRPAEFLATDSKGLLYPGLYSWWVDDDGAADLSVGLGIEVSLGLIYAGQAGATRARSRLKSTNTLWGRIRGMHLGGRHEFSTFRRSLGSVLAVSRDETAIDEIGLTVWMHAHLRIVAVSVNYADSLGDLETEVLLALDPPLNLSKLVKTPLRSRLSELRGSYSQETRSN